MTPPKASVIEFDESTFKGRDWYREHGFIRTDKDEFTSITTFQSVAKAAAQWQFNQLVKPDHAVISRERVESVLMEFMGDEGFNHSSLYCALDELFGKEQGE